MIKDVREYRDRLGIFKDRRDAGKKLGKFLKDDFGEDESAILLGIPAGGVPVAAEAAEILGKYWDVAVVSKATFPDNSEAGFGAVAFDGTVNLNTKLLSSSYLTDEQINNQVEATKERVKRRVRKFRGNENFDPGGKNVILIDDGIASGFTIKTAVEAVKKRGADKAYIAVPTGHENSLKDLEMIADGIYCLNIRSGFSFAVANAYKHWRDVDEEEALEIYKKTRNVDG